jgi:cytochrome P450
MPNELGAATCHGVAEPLDEVDPSDLDLHARDAWRAVFARLRREAPVHYLARSAHGPFWSVTKHSLIVYVERHTELFSSDSKYGGISLIDQPFQNFIAMDRPRHTEQKKVVAPMFAVAELERMEISIRDRTAGLLEALPIGDTFDWVEQVSVELTTQMLAILMDFPWERRRQLTEWSEWSSNLEAAADPQLNAVRNTHLQAMTTYFDEVWRERRRSAPGSDLISRMAHSQAMGDLTWEEKLGNLALLIVGGNDTTRNTMSGMVLAFHQYPDQWTRLRAEPQLLENAVPELIRWQTPIPHMRRTCIQDTELGGQQIREGDKVALWYLSGNRDEEVFQDADRLIVDRPNARQHLAFGLGIHRCLGARLAELQVRILLEQMIERRMVVEVVGELVRPATIVIRGYKSMPVRVRIG